MEGGERFSDNWQQRAVALIVSRAGRTFPAADKPAIATSLQWARETTMITITEKAAAKVREIATAESLDGQGLRLRVVGGGCAGFSYDLYFEDKLGDMDEQFESNGVKLYIDPMSYQYLEGTEIDYIEGLQGAGFKFNNPNSKGSCGCGSSFSA
jgi:iron-sulfur cluster insertion protein